MRTRHGPHIKSCHILCPNAAFAIRKGENCSINPRATKIFCDTDYQGGGGYHHPGFWVSFEISYLLIYHWIQHSFLHRMIYLVEHYVNATRNYITFNNGTPLISDILYYCVHFVLFG